MTDYARPELLAESDWLQAHLSDPNLRVVDCESFDSYRRGHLPGAVGLHVNPYIKDRANPIHVMPPDQFADLMGELGISNDTLVVCYDGNNSLTATRFWWCLLYYGHTNAKVLNGGWYKWIHESRPFELGQGKPVPRGSFQPRLDESCLCTLDYLKERYDKSDAVVLDVRSIDEYTGENDRGNKRAGHIPGAVHLEWLNFITSDARRVFKPADELRLMLAQAGVTPEKEVLIH